MPSLFRGYAAGRPHFGRHLTAACGSTMVRERRSEHLGLDVRLADVRLDGQPVEGDVTRIKLLKRQM
ncbi:hypothetical protein KNE206_66790 [Kitasatospora sp. NE20-6]|uniref:hypothetical protein n=1 Tax=Kitasatospora sp. NE20-6 TaxID=2859066 RepID=UPI0034DCBB21